MSEGIYLSDNQTQFRPQMKARLPIALLDRRNVGKSVGTGRRENVDPALARAVKPPPQRCCDSGTRVPGRRCLVGHCPSNAPGNAPAFAGNMAVATGDAKHKFSLK